MTEREKLQEYRSLAVRCYGKDLTDYQRGVLQGIDCALSLLPDPNRPNPNNCRKCGEFLGHGHECAEIPPAVRESIISDALANPGYCQHEFTQALTGEEVKQLMQIAKEALPDNGESWYSGYKLRFALDSGRCGELELIGSVKESPRWIYRNNGVNVAFRTFMHP